MRVLAALGMVWASLASTAEPVFRVAEAGWQRQPQPGGEPGWVVLRVEVQAGWHVNAAEPSDPFLVPTTVRISLPAGWRAEKAQFPAPKRLKLAVFEEAVEVLEGSFWVRIPVFMPSGAAGEDLKGVLQAQACNDTSCLPPTEVSFTVPWTATLQPAPAPSGTSDSLPRAAGRDFADAAFWLQLVLVFLGGLALNLTPCVYPIIPVTVGFFLQQTGGTRRTAMLAVFYVLGMAVTYSTLGVVAAMTGKLFGAALQSPWVTALIVVVILALAASMFGLWEIRVPQRLAQATGARHGLVGSLVMGLLVGLVAAPCIGPFVLGLLAYVGQKQSVALGFALFFTLSLGLGLPYLFLAISTRSLEKLPHSGAWMEGIRRLFGVLLVALAFYFARPLLPGPWGDRLLALSLLLGGLYLAVIARPGREVEAVDRAMRAMTLLVAVTGAWLWPQSSPAPAPSLTWEKADAAAVQQAVASGVPVVVDFYADWCLPCRELDEKTFSDSQVQAKLASFRRLKVNLTRASAETEELRQAYGVAGVPTVIFFRQGAEVVSARLTGFEPPPAFLQRLELVLGERTGP